MIEFFIRQHKLLNVLIIGILGLGGYYFIDGQKEGFPNIGFDSVFIATSYPGATAEEVQNLITKKIEDAINSVDGRDKITSSSSEGLSMVVFEADTLNTGLLIKDIQDEIKDEIDKITRDLPEEASDPSVIVLSFAEAIPIMRVFIASSISIEEKKNIIKDFSDEIRKISGVSKTAKINYPKTQLWVSADPIKLKEYEIDINELLKAVRNGNINFPSGLIEENNEETLIKTFKPYRTVDDVANTIIRGNDSSHVVKVKDVARSSLQPEELSTLIDIDGDSGIGVSIYKNSSGDVIKVATKIKKVIEDYKIKYPEIKIFYVDDQSFYVSRRFNVLSNNATIGLFLVFLCLIIFFEFKTTFWTTMGIPVSLCLSVIISYQIGITLNLMSMFGYIIVIGMIVDDAIIISENIYQKYEEGLPLMEAAIKGTQEMLVPIFAIVATTAAAFLPLMLLPGIFGKVLGIIPQVVVITMLASFIESVIILPGHIAHMRSNRNKQQDLKQSRAWFQKVKKTYGKMIDYLIKKPVLHSSAMIIFCLGIIFFLGSQIPFVFFPGKVETINIVLETDKSSSLEKTQMVTRTAERKLRGIFKKDIKDYISTIGSAKIVRDGPAKERSYLSTIELKLDPSFDFIEADLVEKIENSLEGIDNLIAYQVKGIKGGPPSGSPIEVKIQANNHQYINEMVEASIKIKETISKISNTTSLSSSYEVGKEEVLIEIDEAQASLLGIAINTIGSTVRTAFQGREATTINTFQGVSEEVEVLVKLDEEVISKNSIPELIVKNKKGKIIPINKFVEIETKISKGQIDKEDQIFYISVSSQLSDSLSKDYNSQKINSIISSKFDEWKQEYPHLNFVMGGAQETQKELMKGAITSAALSIFGVFIILVAVFKSYIQPIIIMSILPFTVVGITIGLFLHNVPIGLMPILGLVALTGVVVNDSLVLVNQINVNRKNNNNSLHTIIVESCKSRLRPILMTSITTVVGLTPIAYGIGGDEPFIAPMALSFLWGIGFSTFIILFLLPNIYLIIDKFLKFTYKKILKTNYKYDN